MGAGLYTNTVLEYVPTFMHTNQYPSVHSILPCSKPKSSEKLGITLCPLAGQLS